MKKKIFLALICLYPIGFSAYVLAPKYISLLSNRNSAKIDKGFDWESFSDFTERFDKKEHYEKRGLTFP